MSKLKELQEYKSELTRTIDAMVECRESLDRCIDNLMSTLETVRMEITNEVIAGDFDRAMRTVEMISSPFAKRGDQ